jgi:hypothetical protein
MLEAISRNGTVVGTYSDCYDCQEQTGFTIEDITSSVLDNVWLGDLQIRIGGRLLWTIVRRELCNYQGKLGVKEIAILEGTTEACVWGIIARARRVLKAALLPIKDQMGI